MTRWTKVFNEAVKMMGLLRRPQQQLRSTAVDALGDAAQTQ